MQTIQATAPATVSAAALRQALRLAGLPFRTIAAMPGIAGGHLKNITQSVYAKAGSNVAHWENRSEAQQAAATTEAAKLIKENLYDVYSMISRFFEDAPHTWTLLGKNCTKKAAYRASGKRDEDNSLIVCYAGTTTRISQEDYDTIF